MPIASIASAVLIVTLVGVGLSVTIPLLALEMERMGVSSTVSGANTAFAGLANILFAPFVPLVAARLGLRQTLIASVLLAMLSILAFRIFPHVGLWFGIRFAFSLAICTLFVLSEYWITVLAPDDRRGLVMGVYATVLTAGFALGPAILTVTGASGWPPYLAIAALFGLAALPLLAASVLPPPLEPHQKPVILPLVKAAPVATLAALVFGAWETATFTHLPVHGTRSGLSEQSAALLVSYATIGNLMFQIPLGWLSDRVDRRRVLLTCATLGAAGSAILAFLPVASLGAVTVLVLWGGITGAIYTVGLAHLGSRFSGSEMAIANAAFVMLYSFGMIAGPPFAGLVMDMAGGSGLHLALGSLLASYATLVLWRMLRLGA